MPKPMPRLLPLATLALLLAVCLETKPSYGQTTPVISTQTDVIASQTYKTVESIQDESSMTKHLTDEQLKTLDTDMDSPYMLVRLQTLVALRHADPKHTQAALAIARRGFSSRDGMTHTYALTTFDRLNASDIVPVAKSALSDRSHFVTDEAHRILTKRGVAN